jgi:hypothetical protein
LPHRPRLIRAGLVGLQARQVPLVLLPGDGGGHAVRQQHRPGVGAEHAAAGARPAGVLAARVDLAPSVGVGPSVERVLQQVLERHPIGPPPLQVAFADPLTQADAELDVVPGQVAQDRVERAQLLELPEDQPHHLLDLFVRVERHLARWPPHVADRQRDRELPAPCLVQPALVHPLLQDVQLGLAHGALWPRNRQHRMVHFVALGSP